MGGGNMENGVVAAGAAAGAGPGSSAGEGAEDAMVPTMVPDLRSFGGLAKTPHARRRGAKTTAKRNESPRASGNPLTAPREGPHVVRDRAHDGARVR